MCGCSICVRLKKEKKTLPKDSDDDDRMCFGNDHDDSHFSILHNTHTDYYYY